MQIQFTGIIRKVGEMQSITTATGVVFNKRELVIASDEMYPETIVAELTKDNAVQFAGKEGQKIMLSLDFHATEHNGRWYNNIRAWRYTLGFGTPITRTGSAAPVIVPEASPLPTGNATLVSVGDPKENGGGLSQSEIVLQKAPTLSPPETLRWFPSGAPDENFATQSAQPTSTTTNQPPF